PSAPRTSCPRVTIPARYIGRDRASEDEREMIVLSRSKNAASIPSWYRWPAPRPGARATTHHRGTEGGWRGEVAFEPHRYPRSRRRQGTWWAPRSSKPVWGRELPGGFDSRPPPQRFDLRKRSSEDM